MPGNALIPKFEWLSGYSAARGARDVVAGTVLAILLVPQAMAYAQLAGLPPQMGLFAALAPPVLYLIFGTSPFVSVGPVALVSLVVAEAAGQSGIAPQDGAAIIAIEAGLMLLLLGGFGLGRLVNFISEPVLLGFTAAAAILIAESQLPTLLGIDAARAGDLPAALRALWQDLPELRPTTAVIGALSLVALLFFNRYAAPGLWKVGVRPPFRQAIAKSLPLAVMVGAAIAAASVPQTVPTVAAIEGGLPRLSFPEVGLSDWFALLPSSLAVAVIIFVTATAVAKSLAGSDRSNLDTSREAVALGAGNVVAALTGGYAVGASLSRSALVADSGARSPVASVIGALAVVAVLFFLAPLLELLPRTALAALVISAVFGLVKWRDMRAVWKHDPLEAGIVFVSFIATLMLGVRLGLFIGALLGLAFFLWFSSTPRVTRIGTDDAGTTFRSIDRDEVELATLPVLIVRIDRSIFFGNASYCEDELFARLASHEQVNCLVLDMSAVNDVDASGVAMLRRSVQRMKLMGVQLHFADAHEPVASKLQSLDSEVCRFHRTIRHAVESCGVYLDTEIAYT